MALSAEEGAKALYRLIYEADPDAPAPKKKGRGSTSRAPRKPYQFPLIGVKSVEELKAERGITTDVGRRVSESGEDGDQSCASRDSDTRHPTSDLRHPIPDIRPPTSDIRPPSPGSGAGSLRPSPAANLQAGIPSAATRRRKPAWNKKPPAKIKCPCGVVFERPAWRAKRDKYHSPECCTKYRASNYKGPAWTPEMDAQIAKVYQEQVGEIRRGNPCPPVRALAESLGMPRWRVSRRALELGLIAKARKEPAWSAEELAFLKAHGHLTWNVIQLKLKQAGFIHRSVNGIKIKFQRMFGNKPHEGYTCRELGKLFGIDAHSVLSWIESGLLRAEHRGTARLPANGGDMWLIRETDVRQFVIGNVELIDFRKLDKFWLVELLTTASEPGQDTKAQGAAPCTPEIQPRALHATDTPAAAEGSGIPAGAACPREV